MLIYLTLLFGVVYGHHGGDHYDHMTVLEDSKYHLHWSHTDTHLMAKLVVETHGYIGFGFSPNGGMVGSDILIAGVDDTGRGYLQDRFAEGKNTPKIDEVQDVELISARENNTHTIIEFKRALVTCDTEFDRPIQPGLNRVIWSYHEKDPDNLQGDLTWHGPTNRGTKNIYIINHMPKPNMKQMDESQMKTLDVKLSGQYVPSDKHTLYWCKIFKYPDWSGKHHMIGYEPLIQRGNEGRVHHIMIQECRLDADKDPDKVFEKYVAQDGFECYSPGMPTDWENCVSSVVTWAVGAAGESFPDDVGYPMGQQHGGSTYFMLEVHYDNSGFEEFFDSSGVRMHLTTQTRKYEAGAMTLGQVVGSHQFIPPGLDEFQWRAGCPSDCLDKNLSPEGIHIFQVLLHSHFLGRRLQLRHVRGGQELEPITREDDYDFNYQQARYINPPKEVKKGDTLITECSYDSSKATNVTYGGFSIKNEMCLAFVLYYPRQPLLKCLSTPTIENFANAVGVKLLELPNLANRVKSEFVLESRQNITLEEHLNATKWDVQKSEQLAAKIRGGSFISECMSNKGIAEPDFTFPEFQRYTGKAPQCFRSRAMNIYQQSAISLLVLGLICSII